MTTPHKEKIVAIITARGGSKGLPGKNIKDLAGKPLIAYSIEAGLNCPLIDATIVTTDDEEIAAVSKDCGAEIIERPAELATDTASSYDAAAHALETLADQGREFETFALLQPTSPLRTARHLEECLSTFLASDAKSAISVCETAHHPYKDFTVEDGALKPLFSEDQLDKPRQSLPPVYRQNGAIYVMGRDDFLNETDNFYLAPVMPYIMSQEDSIDIDTELDMKIAESILLKR